MKVFFVQRNANRSGRFLVISEYGGGQHGSIVILEGPERKGWFGWMFELRNVAVSLGISNRERHVGGTVGSSQPPIIDGHGVTLPGDLFVGLL